MDELLRISALIYGEEGSMSRWSGWEPFRPIWPFRFEARYTSLGSGLDGDNKILRVLVPFKLIARRTKEINVWYGADVYYYQYGPLGYILGQPGEDE